MNKEMHRDYSAGIALRKEILENGGMPVEYGNEHNYRFYVGFQKGFDEGFKYHAMMFHRMILMMEKCHSMKDPFNKQLIEMLDYLAKEGRKAIGRPDEQTAGKKEE
jgi:hypothetical protein